MNTCQIRKLQMRGKKGKTILMPKFAHGKKELACGHFSQEKVVMVVARVNYEPWVNCYCLFGWDCGACVVLHPSSR